MPSPNKRKEPPPEAFKKWWKAYRRRRVCKAELPSPEAVDAMQRALDNGEIKSTLTELFVREFEKLNGLKPTTRIEMERQATARAEYIKQFGREPEGKF